MFDLINKLSIKAYSGCNLNCVYCVSPDTQILMSDLTTKSIKDIKVGDKVVSFNEFSENNKQRKLNTAIVTNVFEPRYVEKLYHIITESNNELYITGEHPLLNGRNRWETPDDLYKRKEQIIRETKLPNFNNISFIDDQYKLGYIISCFLGDGMIRHFMRGNSNSSDIRFIVKDDEINERIKQYLNDINFHYNLIQFKISTKYNIIKEGIRNNTFNDYLKLMNLIQSNINKNTNENYLRGFLAGIYDCEGSYGKDKQLRISQGKSVVIKQIKTALDYFGFKYTFKPSKTNVNIQVYSFRILEESINKFLETIYPACDRKRIKYEGYSPISRVKIKLIEEIEFNDYVYNIETTEHTYIANNIMVHNCHQLFDDKNDTRKFIDCHNLEKFLLEIPLDQNVDVTITGGEITLVPDCFMNVVNVLKKIERKREVKFDVCIVTNGTNMDIVYTWCSKKIVRPDKVAISWDGLYSASKSRLTKGQYNDEFFQNVIKKLGESPFNEDIAVTIAITPQTLPDLYDSFKFCFDNNVFNVGYYFIHEADYDSEDLRKTFSEQIEKIAQLVVEKINNGNNISYYNWQLINTKRLDPKRFFMCGKLGKNYHIDTNGDIYPCIYFGDHRVYKLGSLEEGLDPFYLKQFSMEYLVYPKCKFKTCNCVQCSECPASNLVHNNSLANRFCNLCQLLPIENEIYDKYSQNIESIFRHHLYVPNDLEKYGASINENIYEHGYREPQNRSESCSGIKSPHFEGVRKWSNYHQ